MRGSLFEAIPQELPEEIFQTLFSGRHVKIERIVSRGQASPEDFWYDQEWNEFVLVISGSAGLRIEGDETVRVLRAGDYLNLVARTRHRVEWTDPNRDTIWLAVHYP